MITVKTITDTGIEHVQVFPAGVAYKRYASPQVQTVNVYSSHDKEEVIRDGEPELVLKNTNRLGTISGPCTSVFIIEVR